MTHRHHDWLADVADQMQRDFQRAHAEASKPGGIQESGHHGEHIWGAFLKAWLPPQYEIGYRKYILLETDPGDGAEASAETDIVIFHPSYPPALRERHDVLLTGIVAAFSAKLTLDRAGIDEAVKESAKVRRAAKLRSVDLNGKLLPPFVYGILAHTHSWKAPKSKPVQSITAALDELDQKFSLQPREALDLLCVADLNLWSKQTMLVTPDLAAQLPASVAGPDGHIQYTFLNVGHDELAQDATNLVLPPVAFLIGLLYEKLSYYDDSLSAMADGFRLTDTSWHGLSQAGGNRLFPPSSLVAGEQLDAFKQSMFLRRIYW